MGAESKKAGLEAVRRSLDISDRETIVCLAMYKLVLAYLYLTRQQCRSRLLQHHVKISTLLCPMVCDFVVTRVWWWTANCSHWLNTLVRDFQSSGCSDVMCDSNLLNIALISWHNAFNGLQEAPYEKVPRPLPPRVKKFLDENPASYIWGCIIRQTYSDIDFRNKLPVLKKNGIYCTIVM